MTELLLIVRIAGQRVALPAVDVQSVVDLDGITPVPRSPAHVAGLSALRSRVLTVIDCRRALGLGETEAPREAVVVDIAGHLYGLLVEAVVDVVESDSAAAPLRTGVGRGWEEMSRGVVECGGDAMLLIDAAAIVAGIDQAEAA